MGVPLFYKRIIEAHFREATSKDKPRCTTLALDFAGLEHTTYQYMLENNPLWTIEDYFRKLTRTITDLVRKLEVQQRLIICRDGMAPLGKMVNQRRRRFRTALDESERIVDPDIKKTPFDHNAISPGTDFSIEIDNRLQTYFAREKGRSLPPNVIFSGYAVPGEGEHKIIQHIHEILGGTEKQLEKMLNDLDKAYQLKHSGLNDDESTNLLLELQLDQWQTLDEKEILRRLREGVRNRLVSLSNFQKFENFFVSSESIIVYGLDADLIFLTLPISGPVYIWRENDRVDERAFQYNMKKYNDRARAMKASRRYESIFLNIKTLRALIQRAQIGIQEFIMGSFIFGNDFLPYLPAFNVVTDTTVAFIDNLRGQTFASPFNLSEFQNFLRKFVFIQKNHLYGRLTGDIKPDNERDRVEFPTKIPLDQFEEKWNERLTFYPLVPSNEEENGYYFEDRNIDLKEYAIQYFQTMLWCYNYYIDHRAVNWEWVYYPYWAPTIDQLLEIQENDLDFTVPLQKKALSFNIAGQLALILPRDLRTGQPNPLLPKPVRILQEEFSPIFDFYPKKFIIMRDGVNRPSDGFPFLPPIDFERFLKVFSTINFNNKDKILYTSGKEAQRYVSGGIHSSAVVVAKPEPEEESDVLPIPLFRFEERWCRKATQIFGEKLVSEVISGNDRHFVSYSVINPFVINFKEIPIVQHDFRLL